MKKKIVTLAAALMLVIATFSGCGVDEIDTSGYDNATLTLVGITEEDIIMSVSYIKEMKCDTITTESTSDKIGEVRATGVWLDTLLEPYGYTQEDFHKIKFYGDDMYDVNLYTDYLAEHPIMLAYGIDGEPLDEESKPLRVIIRNSDSAYWVRLVYKIEFEK